MKKIRFMDCIFPIIGLMIVLVYGLVIQPKITNGKTVSLEIIFLIGTFISVINLRRLKFSWDEIQKGIVKKISEALPAIFIIFTIGVLIGSWIISGTIPMLIYYGIKIINPDYIYIIAFIVPIIFSILTGTSWGSIGTIGVVIVSIASVNGANMAIVGGAVVGGSYFGDKMSPLSDTTNIAALSAEVSLFDHIRSMMNTTFPAAILAAICYMLLGYIYKPSVTNVDLSVITDTLRALETIFNFNIILLLPVLIVLYGSFTKKPTVPVLIISAFTSAILSLIFQQFEISDILNVLKNGFKIEMITWTKDIPVNVIRILNRGGLYNLIESIVICIVVFAFLGTLELINAMPIVVEKCFGFVKTKSGTIISSMIATAVTISMTSDPRATLFFVGGAFKEKYDNLNIPRKVLSRSLEDFGTMFESLLPWTTTGIFVYGAIGIPVTMYWKWQLLSLFNFLVAIILAYTGIGCFYSEKLEKEETIIEIEDAV